MVDPELCPESMWEPLQSKLVDLSLKMIEWHENNDGSNDTPASVAILILLDDEFIWVKFNIPSNIPC